MIKLNNIRIESFKSIFSINLDLESLQNNFYSLEGKNNTVDFALSNGSGKSTLCDAISYALYGTTPGMYVKKESYQNEHSSLPMSIELSFDVDDVKYKVERTLNNIKLYKNSVDISELTKTETEKKLQNVLQLTKDEFFNFTYLAQNASNFLNRTASEKFNILKDFIFGDELLKIKTKLDTVLKNKKTSIQELKLQIANLKGRIENSQFTQSKYNNCNLDFSDLEDNILKLKELAQVRESKRKLEVELSRLNFRIDQLRKDLGSLKEQFTIVNKDKICPVCSQTLPKDNTLISDLKFKAKDLKNKSQQDIQNFKLTKQQLLQIPDNLDSDIKELSEKIQKQKSSKERNSLISDLKIDIEALTDDLNKNTIELDKLELELKQLQSIQKYFNTTFIQNIQQSVLSEIENYLNLYCYELFNEKFSLKLTANGLELYIGDKPYAYFSGGERQKIDFLFVFAVKVVLSNFTSKCTNLLIFDESLSGSDSLAFDRCVEVIDKLSRSSGMLVILISHRDNSLTSANKLIINRFKDKTVLDII